VQQRIDALTFAADAVLSNCRDQLVALAARAQQARRQLFAKVAIAASRVAL